MVAEYTARDTPQQNGKVERAIATLKDRATADILRLKCDVKWWGANMIHKTVCDNMMPRKGFNNGYEPFGERPPVKDSDMAGSIWCTGSDGQETKDEEELDCKGGRGCYGGIH